MWRTRVLPAVMAFLMMGSSLAWAQQEETLGGVSYGIGDWPENGFGNHRAVVEVDVLRMPCGPEFRGAGTTPNSARRRCWSTTWPRARRSRTSSPATSRVSPGMWCSSRKPCPASTRSTTCRTSSRSRPAATWNGSYLPPRLVADPAWLAKHGLSDAAYAESGIRFLRFAQEGEDGAIGSSVRDHRRQRRRVCRQRLRDDATRFASRTTGGPVPSRRSCHRDDGRGYKALVYDYGSQLVMGITRRTRAKSDGGEPTRRRPTGMRRGR